MNSIRDLEPQLAANRRYWCGWAGAAPDDDLPIYRTDIPHPLLNGVLRVRNLPIGDAIEEAKNRLTGSAWSWWVQRDSDEGTAERLLSHGAEQVGHTPIMAVDVTTVAEPVVPKGLSIRAAAEPAEIQRYVEAWAGPLGVTGNLGIVVERELNFYPDMVRLAGVVDGRTVGTCTLSLGTADVGGLYTITTDPDYRRRGIATALTLEALRIIRKTGRHFATLQSSGAGLAVYEKIGFRTVAHYDFYQLPE
ncbi:GNAT family N-acetyltransferase [Winogradskya consettensis]|nr:GNAT family N-acetyltransferase [Actinoplanes consettensis]